jgi:uncharacterized protein (DUF1330 family)
MKYSFFSVLMMFFLPSVIYSQNFNLPDLPGYKKTTNYPVYTPDNLWDFINGAADSYLSYGFEDLHVAEYSKGKNVIKLEIYRHKDNILAFGIYSTERSPSFNYIKIGAQGYKADGSLNFLKGKYYVKMRTYSKSEKTLQALESLAIKVSDMLEGNSDLPGVLTEFPGEGRKKNEDIYIQESVLGHEFLKGAYKAYYETGGINFSIFIIENSTVEDARKKVQSYLASAKMELDDQAGGKYVFADGYNGTIFLTWKNNRIVIISGLSKDQLEIADRYITKILK